MTINEFIDQNKIRSSSEWADSNPHMEDSANMNHFKVTLRRGSKRLTIPFSQGYGVSGEPQTSTVLDCLASDAAGVENAQSFEDWADDYGYDTDSRKAEKTYRACEREAKKLRAFLGDDLYDTLLWHTERA